MSHTHKYSSKAVIKMFVMSGPSSVSSLPTSLISLMDATHKDGRVGTVPPGIQKSENKGVPVRREE